MICLFGLKIHAQLGFCGGNSGDPIFTEDFGVGITNSTLPAGTTTYTFNNGFPDDGFYTVFNGSIGNSFDWHQIEDHTTGDVNGKCLIVNAGFSAGEFYRTSVSGLCETTTYEFSAWLINLVIANSYCSTQPSGTIPINVTFEIWDSTDANLLATGNTGAIFETSSPNWEEYALVFQTLPSQTSVILKMINNGEGGCGNDLAIDDIEFKSCGDSITIEDTSNNNSISLCSGETPFSTLLTVTPDNTVFNSHFYQWETSEDALNWSDIIGATSQTLSVSGVTTTMYYRAKVAELAVNLNNADCITFSDTFEVSITQAPNPPFIECWQNATLNNATCSWEITGTQPEESTDLECWQSTSFNNATCSWEITGTQPEEPTGLECWETTLFNEVTCEWETTGTQPVAPTGLECWETTLFNEVTCIWEITGTQPEAPTGLECWETLLFNDVTCLWEITGTQPEAPTGLECWETTLFNDVTCVWETTGTQPEAPTGLECWETTLFNDATCDWDIFGELPIEFIEETISFCEGEDLILSGYVGVSNPEYLWNTEAMDEEITVDVPGIYFVEVTSNNCILIRKTFTVLQNAIPIIESVISDGNAIIITTSNTGDFEYSLDGIHFQLSSTFSNVQGGLYTVYVRGLNECGVVPHEHLHFVIPKFFTPNNDGINDVFALRGIESFDSSEVYIFNRYGVLLKSSKNQPFIWDGTYNNQLLQSSDYWYFIKINDHVFRGHFTLKR